MQKTKASLGRLPRLFVLLIGLALSSVISGCATFHGGVHAGAPEEKFDGHKYYSAVFVALRDNHMLLTNPDTRAKWVAQWEHKHDKDGLLDSEAGAERAVKEMTASLGQRFDYFLDKAETQAETREETATGPGIGIRLTARPEVKGTAAQSLQIEQVVAGSPADKAGLKPGDTILAIDDKPLAGLSVSQALNLIHGDEGTSVKLSVIRLGRVRVGQSFTATIRRAKVVFPVTNYRNLGDGVAYIKVYDFDSQYTVKDMGDALKQAAGAKALIVDLRYNRGGSVRNAVLASQLMLEEGTILTRRDREGDHVDELTLIAEKLYVLRQERDSTAPQKLLVKDAPRLSLALRADVPVVVLVNAETASAAEILAGVLQYQRHATVVGVSTTGKGVGQTVVDLPFGRRIHVTSFKFFPGGKDIDWVGIVPDVEAEQPADAVEDQQLQSARDQAADLISRHDELEQKRQDLKRKHEEEFQKSRQP